MVRFLDKNGPRRNRELGFELVTDDDRETLLKAVQKLSAEQVCACRAVQESLVPSFNSWKRQMLNVPENSGASREQETTLFVVEKDEATGGEIRHSVPLVQYDLSGADCDEMQLLKGLENAQRFCETASQGCFLQLKRMRPSQDMQVFKSEQAYRQYKWDLEEKAWERNMVRTALNVVVFGAAAGAAGLAVWGCCGK